MRYKVISFLLILGVNSVATADTPNMFEPKRPSAESLFVGIESCVDIMHKAFKVPLKENIAMSYCACMMDAAAAKIELKPVAEKCMKRAISIYANK